MKIQFRNFVEDIRQFCDRIGITTAEFAAISHLRAPVVEFFTGGVDVPSPTAQRRLAQIQGAIDYWIGAGGEWLKDAAGEYVLDEDWAPVMEIKPFEIMVRHYKGDRGTAIASLTRMTWYAMSEVVGSEILSQDERMLIATAESTYTRDARDPDEDAPPPPPKVN